MKVLVIGSGGREHALVWALRRSDRVRTLRCAPGNAGIAGLAECVPIGAADHVALERHAMDERYDLVVVGPEAPLVAGVGDRLREGGLSVFGPSAAAAELEGSKVFARSSWRAMAFRRPVIGCLTIRPRRHDTWKTPNILW